MSIEIALNHQKLYRFDRPVILGPHILRLRPIPHCRTPIKSYSLKIIPENYSIHWGRDVNSNWICKLNLPNKTDIFKLEVDLVAEIKSINPFDFLVDDYAAEYPFNYSQKLQQELQSYLPKELPKEAGGSLLTAWVEKLDKSPQFTTSFILAVTQKLHEEINYAVRLEEGIQSCEETLKTKVGSCRDTAWLLVQIFRHLGLAARFVSGYLIQLAADQKPLDGPAGPEHDLADLHAWTEVYLPGAGWIGLDPTSGLLAAEGHIPLACAATPEMAAPIAGTIEPCESRLDFSLTVSRIKETPRMTKPYTEEQWSAIANLGEAVDRQLTEANVGLTMGGEPTFISIDDYQSIEWQVGALGEEKRRLAGILLRRLRQRFSTGGLLYYGMGKWYPGEALPRWALGCYWRCDRVPIWRNFELCAEDNQDYGYGIPEANKFVNELVKHLGVSPENITPAYEGNGELQAYILPLLWGEKDGEERWISCPWQSSPKLTLIPGESPAGLRLPFPSLQWADPEDIQWEVLVNPEQQSQPLGDIFGRVATRTAGRSGESKSAVSAKPNSIKVALAVEVRQGILYVFIPPISAAENYLDLIACVEDTAAELQLKVRIEGYTPPSDRRLQGFQITPDPGVIEVNIHPAHNWSELVDITNILYEEARLTRLGTEKYTLDGRTVSTGGGSHITIGGVTPSESPLLRRPDLLKSLITFWQNHPSLSYLFSGEFVGPTSQSPRVDEARNDTLYELEIAFAQLEKSNNVEPWLVDRLLRNFLIDVSGNTHRSAFCIDKLYPVENPRLQLGLLEFRSITMSPHPQMSLAVNLLIRALVAKFWQQPYKNRLVRWGTMLHDKFFLPHYIAQDFQDVISQLQQAGYPFEFSWYEPFFEFRFPRYGQVNYKGIQLELRQALELWPVLGEEVNNGGTARYVDSSMERVQVLLTGATEGRHIVTCNGYPVPLQSTGVQGEFVAGVRYRARQLAATLHPAIAPSTLLVFDIVDTWVERSIGGCMLYANAPNGAEWKTFPINAREAQGRLSSRFVPHGHTPNQIKVPPVQISPEFPCNLDLRRVGLGI